ncbi:bifunctional homocysteine S-methyltransferase/methylenetetrahydrofolate reductase [Myxococcota bacterium]|nr:bifunctional homocysteine S-methyltransferase/methylenetetrahydrofolate reductase [Myxococcota bacterium]
MDSSFLDAVRSRVVLADGAMGTQLYARGIFINRCYDELTLTHPDLIRSVHEEYLRAGAELITTNTYGANRLRLAGYGLEERARELNVAGVRLARAVAEKRAWVGGSIGPLPRAVQPLGGVAFEEARQVFREQAQALAEGGADVILLETFTDLRALEAAWRGARDACDLPILPSYVFDLTAEGDFDGPSPEQVVEEVRAWGAELVGSNCVNGPQAMLTIVERMAGVRGDLRISAMPNAGMPEQVEGRTMYMASPEYMAENARRLVLKGAAVVGGCCGTTPAMTKEMKTFLRSVQPGRGVSVPAAIEGGEPAAREQGPPAPLAEPPPLAERSRLGAALASDRFIVSVELEPPRGLDPKKAIEGARILHEAGIDLVNIPDGPRAVARMNPMALALMVREQVGMEALVHYCCRDRNILGMQMDLIGANALGMVNLMCITGDPPKMGTYPDATAVFDVDAIGLIRFARNLNHGLDFGGDPLGQGTRLVIGCGCNPGAVNLDVEVERYRLKLEAGAEFVFSQPVYDPELLQRFLERVRGFRRVPVFVGISPLASLRNAEFLHNEVPGMQIPEPVMERLRRAPSREAQREEGVRIAAETLREARRLEGVRGVYVFPPFGNYRAVLKVLESA